MPAPAPGTLNRLKALPVWRALGALGITVALLFTLRWMPGTGRLPLTLWGLLGGALAAWIGQRFGLGKGWQGFLFLMPLAMLWQLGQSLPGWAYPGILMGLLLVFGGGLLTRVPLYNSNRMAWRVLESTLGADPGSFVDLGAGLGGPLAHLASSRPDWSFLGVEASPSVWAIAWLRCRRANCKVRLGSLWKVNLAPHSVAFAFLSPAPMPELWKKACGEMRPGALFLSHTFEVPGVEPERVIPLPGRSDACLRLYRIP